MNDIIKKSLEETEKYLDSISYELVQELSTVISGTWGLSKKSKPEDVCLLDIEVNPDGYRLSLYPMDINSTQLGYRRLLNKYPNGIFRNTECELDTDQFDFDDDKVIKQLVKYDAKQMEIFFEWFIKCWGDTEPNNLNKPIYLMKHDANRSYDLINKKWLKNKEKGRT